MKLNHLGSNNDNIPSLDMDTTTESDTKNNHEKVLDSETYANQTFKKTEQKEDFDLFSTIVPICRRLPVRVHVEVVYLITNQFTIMRSNIIFLII